MVVDKTRKSDVEMEKVLGGSSVWVDGAMLPCLRWKLPALRSTPVNRKSSSYHDQKREQPNRTRNHTGLHLAPTVRSISGVWQLYVCAYRGLSTGTSCGG